MLFFRKNTDKPEVKEIDLTDVQRRVHGMREVTQASGSLQLFTKLGQEGRSRRDLEVAAPAGQKAEVQLPRVLPEQVPTTTSERYNTPYIAD